MLDMPLAATLEMSRKLNAAHYYTDTATFSLRCEVCSKGLVGEKEAKERAWSLSSLGGHGLSTHADVKATGHSSFAEYS